MNSPLHRLRICIALACMLISGAGCQSKPPPPPLPDIVLITIDTLRADYLSCYGHPQPTSPNIDKFASQSLLFENAVSASAATGASMACVLTGKYPRFTTVGYANRGRLDAKEVTLAEQLAAAGYQTAAFVCNPVLGKGSGAEQGFELFDDEMDAHEQVRKYLRERTADKVTDRVLAWLPRRDTKRPLFLWVHYQDPHGPYLPPKEFADRFRPADAGPLLKSCGQNNDSGIGCVPFYQLVVDPPHLNEYIGRYEGEIAFADHHVGRLLQAVAAMPAARERMLMLTADHGESMNENDIYFRHGQSVSRELSHVPLMLQYPGVHAGVRSKTPAGHIDVHHTILAAARIADVPRKLETPIDLRNSDAASTTRVLYCDISSHLGVFSGDRALLGFIAPRKQAETGRFGPADFKPILLCDYWRKPYDPIEDRALSERLEKFARDYMSEPPAQFQLRPMDEKLKSALRNLGYLQGG